MMSGECPKCSEHCLDCKCNSEILPMEWISVKDNLPKENEWIYLGSNKYQTTSWGVFMNGKFVNPDLNYFEIPFVTHWMPLPDAPES